MPYKLINGQYQWVEESDATRVSAPVTSFKVKRLAHPGMLLLNVRGKTIEVPISGTTLTVSADTRSSQLRRIDGLKSELKKLAILQQLMEQAGSDVLTVMSKLWMPSTYVGPMLDNSDRPYGERVLGGEGSGDPVTNFALDMMVPYAASKGALALSYLPQTPRWVFNHLPYKTIDVANSTVRNFGRDLYTFLKTPLNENPIRAVQARRFNSSRFNSMRSDVADAPDVAFIRRDLDPMLLIIERNLARLNRRNLLYAYPLDGISFIIDPELENAQYLVDQIPVKDYLSLKEVYNLNLGRSRLLKDKISSALTAPYAYFKVNMNPAFAWVSPTNRFVKVNKKALADLGFDYKTVLSHEFNHILSNNPIIMWLAAMYEPKAFDYSHLRPGLLEYLKGTELLARGTLLKNYFNTDVLTGDMLRLAAKNYVKDMKFDNNMYQFFSGIKDWDKAAEYLTKFSLKHGGPIKIKDENKGKFTASAKKAGQSVLEYANSVLSDPNATTLLKKRANFARNASKWNK